MPDPCANCHDCRDCPWCPSCEPCGVPGGLLDPHDPKPKLGSPATFYGWENGKNYSARIDELSDDGLWAGAMIFLPQGLGQYWEPHMPIASIRHEEKRFKTVKRYVHEREEYLEIFGRHLHAFGEAWLASGNLLPTPSFSRHGSKAGEFFPPFKEGFDCTAIVIKEAMPAVVDLCLQYSSGRGYSIQRAVEVLNLEQVEAMKIRRQVYCAMRQPFLDAAQAEWDSHYSSY